MLNGYNVVVKAKGKSRQLKKLRLEIEQKQPLAFGSQPVVAKRGTQSLRYDFKTTTWYPDPWIDTVAREYPELKLEVAWINTYEEEAGIIRACGAKRSGGELTGQSDSEIARELSHRGYRDLAIWFEPEEPAVGEVATEPVAL